MCLDCGFQLAFGSCDSAVVAEAYASNSVLVAQKEYFAWPTFFRLDCCKKSPAAKGVR